MRNDCDRCNGSGKIKDPKSNRWLFWEIITCSVCGGDGYARPPEKASPTIYPPAPPKKK